MTTAHKATFHPAMGHENRGGTLRGVESIAVSALEAPAHTKLHMRRDKDVFDREDFKAKLELEEAKATEKRREMLGLPSIVAPEVDEDVATDHTAFVLPEDEDDSSESSSWSSDDEEDELEKELERLRAEREKKEEELKKEKEHVEMEASLNELKTNNPLLADSFSIKKKYVLWYLLILGGMSRRCLGIRQRWVVRQRRSGL